MIEWDIMAQPEPTMLLKRLYYWKGMKTDINIYVKQCKLCQMQNIVPVKY